MIYDSIDLLGNTQLANVTVDSGTSFPSLPTLGEMFFKTDSKQMFIYNGTEWMQTSGVAQASSPKITGVVVTNSTYSVDTDDTAVDLTGGYIKIIGTGFVTGATVRINQTLATSVAFVSATELRVQVPPSAAGSYNLYVINPDASVAIRVNGLTYSAFPAWSTGSSLSGVVNEAISIQLSAPSATSYVLATGSTLPAGLTLTSGGLLSGTVTGLTELTTYSFTIIAMDAENQDTSRAFALTVSVVLGDANFRDTVLLLKTAPVEGGTNNSIIDSSVASHHITRVGNAAPSSFSPYGLTGWSNFFDGTGDYLQGGSALPIETGPFTIECWVYPTTTISSNAYVIGSYYWQAGNNGGYTIDITSGRLVRLNASNGTWNSFPTVITSTLTVNINQWSHIAITRNASNQIMIYINGQQAATAVTYASSLNLRSAVSTQELLRVGTWLSDGAPTLNFTGYISNARIVPATALYTSNFTPSTTPLTAVAGTSLLTCQSNRFVDNSTNNFAITRNGDAKVTTFSPFKFRNNEYAIANAGGAAYFDGTDDFLSFNGVTIGANPYTIECWFYHTGSFGTAYAILGTSNSNALNVRINNSTTLAIDQQGVGQQTFTVPTMSPNTWNHLVFVRDTNNASTVFLNGARSTTGAVTMSQNYSASSNFIGRIGSNYFPGYISNLRVVVGSAIYSPTSTNINIPSSPLTAVTGTSLLTLQGDGLRDNSTNNFTLTTFGDVTPTAQSPFRTINQRGSVYFDGAGDSLQTATVPALGTSDFTIEFWVYPMATTRQDWFDAYIASPTSRFLIYYDGTSINVYGNPPNSTIITGGAITLNRWMHIAVSRQSNSIRLFINGTQSGSTYTTPQNFSGNVIHLGRDPAGSTFVTGYLSNVRVVNGTALYTSNFTPSTTPLTAVAGTSLLTCQNNGIRDNSSNAFAITRNGDARAAEFSPFALTQETSYAGSVYLDGSDHIETQTSPALILGGDFTIDFWAYRNTTQVTSVITLFELGSWSSGTGILFRNTGTDDLYINAGSSRGAITSMPGQWAHFAISRSGTTVRVFVNGAQIISTTVSGVINSSGAPMRIGSSAHTGGQFFTGYISNFRILNGTALYTSAFTPPTAPVAAVQNTSLLVNGGARPAIYDATGRNPVETVGNADTVMTIKRFADSSMFFDGSGDYLRIPSSEDFGFSTGNFTIEGWFNALSLTDNRCIIDFRASGGGGSQVKPTIYIISSRVTLLVSGGSQIQSGVLNTNQWYHFAVVRNSGVTRMYIDGIQVGSNYTDTNNYGITNVCIIGQVGNDLAFAGGGWNGYLEDIRITRGVARYTSSFTPPSRAFLTTSD